MKWLFTVIPCFVLLAGCGQLPQNDKVDRSNVKTIASEDEQMKAAIEMAKRTFPRFDTAFVNGHFDTSQFSVKVRFETAKGGEHIWTYGLTRVDGAYFAFIDEDGVENTTIKQGDKVRITADNLSDWLYNDNGVLQGGYTIRVIRNLMSPEERAGFDSTFRLKIIDE